MKPGKNYTGKNDVIEIVLIVFAWLIALIVLYCVLYKLKFL